MNKALIAAFSIGALLISGCASTPVSTFEPFQAEDLNGLLTSGQYQQKVDNFFVINDSSSSMGEEYEGPGFASAEEPIKLSVEKELLSRLNQTIPDLNLTAGIRSFGWGTCLGMENTKLNMPPAPYSKPAFSSGIDALTCASGGTPMHSAIEAASSDLSGMSGPIAMLILSDGHELQKSPVPAMQALKKQYGDRLCVYTVWVGNKNEEQGKIVLHNLSDIAGCGYGADVGTLSTPSGMAGFVKSVFLKPADCSTMDSDGDGVNNCNDQCPNTLKNAHVNQFGCWIVDIKFDNDKSNIKPQYFEELDNAAAVINANPGVSIEVQGHTSNTASAAYNQKLSERRAVAVTRYLKAKVGSNAILTPRGYGLTQPIDTNATEQGRANNRRVELKVLN